MNQNGFVKPKIKTGFDLIRLVSVYNLMKYNSNQYRKCPSFCEAPSSARSTSMTEENCSYFKNMRNTHLLDGHNNLPGCEIELS